jgi:hypothetical protein
MAATATMVSTLRQSSVKLKHYKYLVNPERYYLYHLHSIWPRALHQSAPLATRRGLRIGHVHLPEYPSTSEESHHTPAFNDHVWLLGRCTRSITYALYEVIIFHLPTAARAKAKIQLSAE